MKVLEKKKVVIVIPTYNEKDNIGRLIDYIQDHISPQLVKSYELFILVVDDSSPDGTADLVQRKAAKDPHVHLFLNTQKMGLGGAYMKGMEYAVDHLNADILFEMDADFSHDPKVVPAFLKKMNQGYDLVLGSRYIRGGSIPDNWGLHRKLLSAVGNLVIRIVLTHFAIKDWTTGYRALTRKLFLSLKTEMKRREFAGYTFQIGFLHKAIRKGFKVGEVPIQFIDREYGDSKLGIEYIKNTLVYIFTIRARELKRLIKFGVVGAVGFIVNFTALEVFYKGFDISPDNAAAMGAELAIISNFTLNNLWTFKDRKIVAGKKLLGKFFQFNLASLGAVAIQKIVVWLGIQWAGEPYYLLYFIFAVGLGMVLNFFLYSKVIWKK